MDDDFDMIDAPAPAPAGGTEGGGDGFGDDAFTGPPSAPAAANDGGENWDEDEDCAPPPPLPPASGGHAGVLGAQDVVMQNVEHIDNYSAPPPAATASTYRNSGGNAGGYTGGGASGYGGAYTGGGEYNTISRPAQGAGSTKLFVGNLSWNVDEPALRREFEIFGTINAVTVVSDQDTGRTKGFGYVEFANTADAVQAMSLKNGAMVDGRNIKIDFSVSSGRPQRSTGAGGGGGFGGGFGGGAKNAESETLFVANLPYNVTQEMLREAFHAHGTLIDVRVPTDHTTGTVKGFAYVAFQSVDEARSAMEKMNDADIGGRSIRLDYAQARCGSDGGAGGGGGAAGGGESNPPSLKLFVGSFSDDADEYMMRDKFQDYGTITDVYVPKDPLTGLNRGFAYVSLSSVEEAMAAVQGLNGTDLAGRNIRLDYAVIKERAARGGAGGASANSPSVKLFVGNFADEATEDDLREKFEACGTLADVYVPKDGDTGMNRGFAFVSYSTVEEAIMAMETLNGTDLAGQIIRLDYAEVKERAAKAPSGPFNPPSVKLFIGSFADEATEEELREKFEACGPLADLYIPKDSDTGLNKGFAYVSYSTVEEAIAAMESLNGTELAGRNIRLDYAEVKQRAPRESANMPSLKLFIGNVSEECTEEVLRDAFGEFGQITDCFIPMVGDTGLPRGIAFISFSSVDEAIAAKEALDGSEIGGQNIRLDYSEVKQRPGRESSTQPSLKLFIGNVSEECTEGLLREAFGEFGEITDCFIPMDSDTGLPRGIAFISFSSVDEAIAAKEKLDGSEIGGQNIRLDFAEVKQRPPKQSSNDPSLKLFIGNVSEECTEDVLCEVFGEFGEVTDCFIPVDSETGLPRGIAFLSFSSVEEAITAMEKLNGAEIGGQSIRLDYAEVKERGPRESNNEPSMKLRVGNVSEECTEDILKEAFGECGEVTDIYAPMDDDTGAPRGYAFITFSSVGEAMVAVESLNNTEIAGKSIRVDYAEVRERPPREARPVEPPSNPESTTLFVGSLSSDATVDIIRAAFAPHGSIMDIRIPFDADENSPKGFCYVDFATVEEAIRAVEAMNGAEIAGRQIRIDYAEPRLAGDFDPNKPRIPDIVHAFDPNEAVHARMRERNTHVAAEINVPDRFELFLLQDGEKKITETIDTRTPNSSIFTILKEDHTLCNLLRAHLLQNPAVLFAGYKIPHPLFAKVELRVQTDGSITPKEAVIQCSKKLVSDLGQFSREFTKEFELRKMVANASAAPQVQNGQI